MAVDAALVSAGGAVVGDVMAQQGARGTNATSMQMMYAQDAFNAKQASINRTFQDTEAGKQRAWSAAEVALQDKFQANMADTQMQRRVQDLRKADLNPALAYELGGAASPVGATPTSGTPGGSQASAVGVPSLQNPNLGFGQLGGQVATAEQVKSNVNLQTAQANKANAETGAIPAQVEQMKSMTGLNDVRAAEAYKNVQLLEVQLEPSDTSDASMAAILQKARVQIANMDVVTQKDTMAALIKARNDESFADAIHAENIYHASDGTFGKIMGFFQTGEPAITSAKSIGSAAADTAGIF